MEIALIYACASNGVIGKDGHMPWHLPEDLAHFKTLTSGAPVIMGRKTWDSLPPRFRPLPGRSNIVITRQTDWHETGAQCASSLRQALSIAEQTQATTAWILGGAQIYAQALPLAQRVEMTLIEQDFDGDALAPTLAPTDWKERSRHTHMSSTGLRYHFVRWQRTNAPLV